MYYSLRIVKSCVVLHRNHQWNILDYTRFSQIRSLRKSPTCKFVIFVCQIARICHSCFDHVVWTILIVFLDNTKVIMLRDRRKQTVRGRGCSRAQKCALIYYWNCHEQGWSWMILANSLMSNCLLGIKSSDSLKHFQKYPSPPRIWKRRNLRYFKSFQHGATIRAKHYNTSEW